MKKVKRLLNKNLGFVVSQVGFESTARCLEGAPLKTRFSGHPQAQKHPKIHASRTKAAGRVLFHFSRFS
jgi:hypothetical protein